MRERDCFLSLLGALATAGALASCDKGPTRPGGGGGPSTVIRIEIVAPPELGPGESVQLRANAIKSDGSLENVTDRAQWTSGTSEIVQLSATGLATGGNRGEVLVTARFGGVSGTARIWVLPKGTHRLAGTIVDFGAPLSDVTVAVIAGVGEGLTTVSGLDGSYALYGVSGSIRLRLSKEGYTDSFQQLDVTAHRIQDFGMSRERKADPYTGTYTLTIFTTGSCEAGFPDWAKRRVYTAKMVQNASYPEYVNVTLSDADFRGVGNYFYGTISQTGVITLFLDIDYYGYNYSIVEHVGESVLVVKGVAMGTGTPGRILATLDGTATVGGKRCSGYQFEMIGR